jgi:hypothetical protein
MVFFTYTYSMGKGNDDILRHYVRGTRATMFQTFGPGITAHGKQKGTANG